jgi:hypothetical protein
LQEFGSKICKVGDLMAKNMADKTPLLQEIAKSSIVEGGK